MTGASPVTTILGLAWQSHAVADRCIVVTGLAPVMLAAFRLCVFFLSC